MFLHYLILPSKKIKSKKMSRFFQFFLLTLFIKSPIFGQGFQVNLQGQAQQGMGSAGTAFIQDASAVFFNPGGVSFLTENSVSVGATAVIANTVFMDANSYTKAKTVSPTTTPFTAYAVWGKDSSKLKFGLGVYTPFGSIVKWEEKWVGRFALTSLGLQTIFFQPTASYKINEKLGVGAGLVYGIGNVELKQDLPLIDNNGNYGSAALTGKGNGFGFNAGIYFLPIEKLALGLSYRSQVNMKVNNGSATFVVPGSLSSFFPNGGFSATLPLPQVFTLGLMYKPINKLTMAFDANFVGWKAYDTLAFDYDTNTDQLQDTKMPRNYKNTFAFRLGAQYAVLETLKIRAGLGLPISPIQSGFVTPELPEATRINYSCGIGYTIKNKFKIDASYTLENFERKDNNTHIGIDGTYKTSVSGPGLSLTYIF